MKYTVPTNIDLKARREFYESCGFTIVSRAEVARDLNLAPNRVSELTSMGVLEEVGRNPYIFALEHCRGCYADYRWWLTIKENGDRYAR